MPPAADRNKAEISINSGSFPEFSHDSEQRRTASRPGLDSTRL